MALNMVVWELFVHDGDWTSSWRSKGFFPSKKAARKHQKNLQNTVYKNYGVEFMIEQKMI